VSFVKNYDGDTITVNIPGQHPVFGNEISVRIKGIDTPEIRSKSSCEMEKSRIAKRLVGERLEAAKSIHLKDVSRVKYFRVVADVIADGESLGELLINQGLAVGYDGGRKPATDWCSSLNRQ
jgi:micrococcal nuclease